MTRGQPFHNLVPEFIIRQDENNVHRGAFDGVALFVDVSGFSNLTSTLMVHGQHGAEVLATIMRSVFTPLIESVYEHGGFVATLAGDAFTGIFIDDAPGWEANASTRAFAAAWEIQQFIGEHLVHRTDYGEFLITVKTGIAGGHIDWGIIAAKERERATYYFRGDPLDASGDAEHFASAGDIVVDATVYESLKNEVLADPVHPFFKIKKFIGALPQGKPYAPPPPNFPIACRFFPESLVTQPISGEFRQVVNVFIQLPEIPSDFHLIDFTLAMFAMQDKYGGLLNRLDFGDKGAHLLLFWGAPVAYETDIERALDFVRELKSICGIPFTAGLTFQISHAGFIGSALREEFTSYGRGVNLAARFMTSAPKGEIWVDESIASRAAAKYEFSFEGEMPFKGFSKPQAVYSLGDPREQTITEYRGRLVGRQVELAKLYRFVLPIFEHRFAGSLVIWGEAGMGKSRLVNDFLSQIEAPFLWALCQTDQIFQESLHPFRYWLKRYFDQSPAHSDEANKKNFYLKLESLLAETADPSLSDEVYRTRSFLGAMLGLHWPGSLYEQLDGQGRFENTLIGLTALIRVESTRQPVVLHLEDVHWLDSDSRMFIPRLIRTLTAEDETAYPVALIATARPRTRADLPVEGEAILGEGAAFREVVLDSLQAGDLSRLVDSVVGGASSPNLIELVSKRSEGNPFFAEQIIRFLQEGDYLVETETGETTLRLPRDTFIPTDIRTVLVARLDSLSQKTREIVQSAAVLGRDFELRVLEEMMEGKVENGIREAEGLAIWARADGLQVQFQHALLRDTAYRMLVHSRRQALHKRAANAIETVYTDNPESQYGELGYHTELAGMHSEARGYYKNAGAVAADAYQNHQAVDYFTKALGLAAEENVEFQHDVLVAKEAVEHLLGLRDQQTESLEKAGKLAEAAKDPRRMTKVWLMKARLSEELGAYDRQISAAQNAIALASKAAETRLVAEGCVRWGAALHWQGDSTKAKEQLLKALEIYQSLSDEKGEGDVYFQLGEIARSQSEYETAQQYLEKSLSLDVASGDLRREAASRNSLGVLFSRMQDFGRAKDYLLDAVELYQKIGLRARESASIGNLGTISHRIGQYDDARKYYEQSLQTCREVGDRKTEAIMLNNLGEIFSKQGRYQSAKDFFEQALAIEEEIGFQYGVYFSSTLLGETLLALEEAAPAKTMFSRALEICDKLGFSELLMNIKLGLAKTAQIEWDFGVVNQYLENEIQNLDSKSFDSLDDPIGFMWNYYLFLHPYDDAVARNILAEAYRRVQAQAAKIPDLESRESYLTNVPENQEIIRAYSELK